MATVDFNILNILSDSTISENIKFREYCRFYGDLAFIDCIRFPKNVMKLKEVLDDGIQEFYPDFQILLEFFKIQKILVRQPITSFNLGRLRKLYLIFNRDIFNSERNLKTFKYDFSKNVKLELLIKESQSSSLIINTDERGLMNLYSKSLPSGYYYQDKFSDSGFPIAVDIIDKIRDIKLFTEGLCKISYKSGGKIIEVSYEE